MQIEIPYQWTPAPYQVPIFQAIEKGIKRIVLVWHRQAGKDTTLLNAMAMQMLERVGSYWFLLPQYGQARKAIWDSVNPKTGVKRLDQVFPKEIRKKTRESDMFIELKNGSTFQLVGSDRPDTLIGSTISGVIFSEYATSNPEAWKLISPILMRSGGFAWFNSTARGENHFYHLYQMAKDDPEWYASNVTVADSNVYTLEELERERKSLISANGEADGTAIFEQEYYNSFAASLSGAYYGSFINELDQKGHIGNYPYIPNLPVNTAWDIGYSDSTAIWFYQKDYNVINIFDYVEASLCDLPYYLEVLEEKRKQYKCVYGRTIVPHDIKHNHVSAAPDRLKTFYDYGYKIDTEHDIIPALKYNAQIEFARGILPRCRFNKETTIQGINCLKNYRKKWNENTRSWSVNPVHDWASHGAQAFAYLAIGENMQTLVDNKEKVKQYNPYNVAYFERLNNIENNTTDIYTRFMR